MPGVSWPETARIAREKWPPAIFEFFRAGSKLAIGPEATAQNRHVWNHENVKSPEEIAPRPETGGCIKLHARGTHRSAKFVSRKPPPPGMMRSQLESSLQAAGRRLKPVLQRPAPPWHADALRDPGAPGSRLTENAVFTIDSSCGPNRETQNAARTTPQSAEQNAPTCSAVRDSSLGAFAASPQNSRGRWRKEMADLPSTTARKYSCASRPVAQKRPSFEKPLDKIIPRLAINRQILRRKQTPRLAIRPQNVKIRFGHHSAKLHFARCPSSFNPGPSATVVAPHAVAVGSGLNDQTTFHIAFAAQLRMSRPSFRSKQLVELRHQALKVLECRVDRAGLLHVDAGVAQQVERELRAAALEEAEIVVRVPRRPPLVTRSARAIAADRPVAYL